MGYYSFLFRHHLVHEEIEGASTYITYHDNTLFHVRIVSFGTFIFLAKPPIVMFCWGFSSAPISNFVTVKALYTGQSLIKIITFTSFDRTSILVYVFFARSFCLWTEGRSGTESSKRFCNYQLYLILCNIPIC